MIIKMEKAASCWIYKSGVQGKKVWAGVINVGVVGIQMVFKAKG